MQLHAIDVGQGEPLVLIHGLGSSHRDWEAQIAAFAPRRRVIAVDLRGHGGSPPARDGVTIDDLARDVIATLDARGVGRCDVAGWSLGGMVAAMVAAARPALVRRLIIVNSPPGALDTTLRARLKMLERKLLIRHLPPRLLGTVVARRVFRAREHELLRRRFAARFLDNDPGSYRAVFDAIARHDDGGVLERIACPVLIVTGEHDYWPVAAKRSQSQRLDDARVAVIAAAGHGAPQERPDEFNRVVAGFLDEPDRERERDPDETRGRAGAAAAVAAAILTSACSHGALGAPDAPPPPPPPIVDAAPSITPSRCTVTPQAIACDHQITSFAVGGDARDVYWETPTSPPPPGGYPIVVLFQGSLFGPQVTWSSITPSAPFGAYQQARLQAMLLDHGFTVVAPTGVASLGWQTNVGVPFEATSDAPYVAALIEAIRAGRFGPADATRMYATGISSGGYMTSRMAVSFGGVFRALAIHSASYATCLGLSCAVPEVLPPDHPPTLFLHGGADPIVPIATMRPYHDELVAQGIEAALDVDDHASHEWLADSPERITAWFEAH